MAAESRTADSAAAGAVVAESRSAESRAAGSGAAACEASGLGAGGPPSWGLGGGQTLVAGSLAPEESWAGLGARAMKQAEEANSRWEGSRHRDGSWEEGRLGEGSGSGSRYEGSRGGSGHDGGSGHQQAVYGSTSCSNIMLQRSHSSRVGNESRRAGEGLARVCFIST